MEADSGSILLIDGIKIAQNCNQYTPTDIITSGLYIGPNVLEYIVVVPYHGGGRSKKINAWYLNTHMVYL